jgi:hypothetical protein
VTEPLKRAHPHERCLAGADLSEVEDLHPAPPIRVAGKESARISA